MEISRKLELRTSAEIWMDFQKVSMSDTTTISDVTLTEPLDLRTSTGFRTVKKIVFENVEFKQANFENIDFTYGIEFKNCRFLEKVEIIKCKGHYIAFDFCEFKDEMILREIERIPDFQLHRTLIPRLNLIIQRINKVTISKCKVDILQLSFSEANHILLSDINLGNMTCVGQVLIFSIQNNTIKTASIQCSKTRVTVTNVKIVDSLFTGLNELQSLYITKLVGSGELSIVDKLIKTIEISDSNFRKLIFENFTLKNEYKVKNTWLSELSFDTITVRSDLVQLYDVNLNPGGVLKIKNSDLGKTSFINCDFSKSKCQFENGKLHEIFLAETKFPASVHSSESDTEWHEQSQLFFGQLQSAYNKQGDNIRANDYQSREIEAHFKNTNFLIKMDYKPFIWIPRSKWLRKLRNFSISPTLPNMTWVSLGLNRLSNGFGRRWFRGVLFAFVFGLMFFLFMIWSTPEYSLGWDFVGHWVGAFLRFMNPLRQFNIDETLKLTNEITLTGWSYIWDFLGRIFVAYGYYQTIQAFRRYGKK